MDPDAVSRVASQKRGLQGSGERRLAAGEGNIAARRCWIETEGHADPDSRF
jgi:hypothetical protein